MIFRFLVTWLLLTNGGGYSETISGYFNGGNHYYQEPASFLGWGAKSGGNISPKSSSKGKGKSHSSTGNSRIPTTTLANKQSTKHGKGKTSISEEVTRPPGETSTPITLSSHNLARKTQAVTNLYLWGMSVGSIPQEVTSKPVLPYWMHQADPALSRMVPSYDLQPRVFYPPAQQQLILPQYLLPQPHFVQGVDVGFPRQLMQTIDPLCQDEDGECTLENVLPNVQLANQEFRNLPMVSSSQQFLNKIDFADKSIPKNVPKLNEEEARHTLFVHPKLVGLMRAMDHSLLSYPSRFDYRPVQPGSQKQVFLPFPRANFRK